MSSGCAADRLGPNVLTKKRRMLFNLTDLICSETGKDHSKIERFPHFPNAPVNISGPLLISCHTENVDRGHQRICLQIEDTGNIRDPSGCHEKHEESNAIKLRRRNGEIAAP